MTRTTDYSTMTDADVIKLANSKGHYCGVDHADGMNHWGDGWYYSLTRTLPLVEDSAAAAKSDNVRGPFKSREACEADLAEGLRAMFSEQEHED